MIFMPSLIKGNSNVPMWEGSLWYGIHAKFNENLAVLSLRKRNTYESVYMLYHIR